MFGITGTPGTGKKTAALSSSKILGVQCLNIDDLARSEGLAEHSGEEVTVDAGRLKRRLEGRLRGPAVVYGHILPYVLEPAAVEKVVVLRCDPEVLKRRLMSRGYRQPKVIENVEAELIGLVSSDAFDAFGKKKTFEVDTTRTSPMSAAGAVASIAGGKGRPGPRIDWTLGYDSGRRLRSLLSVP